MRSVVGAGLQYARLPAQLSTFTSDTYQGPAHKACMPPTSQVCRVDWLCQHTQDDTGKGSRHIARQPAKSIDHTVFEAALSAEEPIEFAVAQSITGMGEVVV